jgi:hypothetical protein
MTATTTELGWLGILSDPGDACEVWTTIFHRLGELALSTPKSAALHEKTVVPDRLLAESAWNLWEEFPSHAPSVVNELKQFWVSASSVGTAVLILDGLSLRELSPLVTAMKARGIEPLRILVRAAEVPTETDHFAAALGISGRSKLSNNQPPATFIFKGPDLHCEVFEQTPFADCVGSVSAAPRLFLWHTWPDEELIHQYEDNKEGPHIVEEQTREKLTGDDFWNLVNRMRKGRRLVITSDHGYATSKWFSSKVTDEDSVKLLRQFFGAKRSVRENADNPWPRRHLPPLICRHNGWLSVMGQRKWDVQGGFPHLCHRGLSLLEAALPFVELPPL